MRGIVSKWRLARAKRIAEQDTDHLYSVCLGCGRITGKVFVEKPTIYGLSHGYCERCGDVLTRRVMRELGKE